MSERLEYCSVSDLSFCVIGDMHSEQRPEITDRIYAEAVASKPDFITLLGDLTSDGTLQSYQTHVSPIFKRHPFPLTFSALGNHDQAHDWMRFIGGHHYNYFRYKGRLFLWLYNANETDPKRNDPQQWSWLERLLAIPPEQVFVFAHCPPNIVGRWGYHSFDAQPTHDLLKTKNVKAFFAGHIHAYDQETRDGIRYFLTGGGGGTPYNVRNLPRIEPHFMHVGVRAAEWKAWRVFLQNGELVEEIAT